MTPSRVAVAVVAEDTALRRSHGHVPALDVLDLVMQGLGGVGQDFGTDATPPARACTTPRRQDHPCLAAVASWPGAWPRRLTVPPRLRTAPRAHWRACRASGQPEPCIIPKLAPHALTGR